jgi:hypothetical protein
MLLICTSWEGGWLSQHHEIDCICVTRAQLRSITFDATRRPRERNQPSYGSASAVKHAGALWCMVVAYTRACEILYLWLGGRVGGCCPSSLSPRAGRTVCEG